MKNEDGWNFSLVGLTLVPGKEVVEILPESTAMHRMAQKLLEVENQVAHAHVRFSALK